MPEGLSTRTRIAILIYSMTNAVLFGIGIVIVLNVPSLAAHAGIGIPVVVMLSLLLAAPIAWFIAPRLRPLLAEEGGGDTQQVARYPPPRQSRLKRAVALSYWCWTADEKWPVTGLAAAAPIRR